MLQVIVSCAPVYVPNIVHTGMLKDQGEVKVTAALGTSGADLGVAYAPINNFEILAHGHSRLFMHHFYGSAGLGYTLTPGDQVIVELAGYYGEGESNYEGVDGGGIFFGSITTIGKGIGSYRTISFQPSLGIYDKDIDMDIPFIVLSIRYTDLRYFSSRTLYVRTIYIPYSVPITEEIRPKRSAVMLEPAITVQYQSGPFKIFSQLQFTWPVQEYISPAPDSDFDLWSQVEYSKMILSFGLSYYLSGKGNSLD